MRRITVHLTNPHWQIFEDEGHLVLTTSQVEWRPGARPLNEYEDGVTIVIDKLMRSRYWIQAFRSISSSDQLYYYCQDDEGLLLSDQFAVIIGHKPVESRRVSDAILLDHFLFRTTPGSNTYLEDIMRLGHGEEIAWQPNRARPVFRTIHRLERQAYASEPKDMQEMLEGALETALSGMRRGCATSLLSGGVDSTLLHSFLDRGAPSISASIDSPEFRDEIEYATAAAKLLGATHSIVSLAEAEYEDRLQDVIRRSGLPPHHLQTVLIDAAVSTPEQYVTGQFADALFGLEKALRVGRILDWRLNSWQLLFSPMRAIPWSRAQRFERTLRSDLNALRFVPEHPDGFAMRFATYTDIDAMRALVGPDAVNGRLQERLEYVTARLAPYDEADHSFFRHLELGHWIDFFCDDTVAIWRQCAHARGSSLAAPFTDRVIVEAALRIPARWRFYRGRQIKPILKVLLKRRLPEYPIHQPKGGSGLPVGRFLATGPLADLAASAITAAWPFRLPTDSRSQEKDWLVWNQLTFRVWDELVRRSNNPPRRARITKMIELVTTA